MKVVKNKVAPPFREAEFEIMYGRASTSSARSSTWREAGLVEKSGTCYSYKGERIAQGRDKACATSPSTRRSPQEMRLHADRDAQGRERGALGARLAAARAAA